MDTALSVLSIVITPLERLGAKINQLRKEKKVKGRLFNALSVEIREFLKNFEEVTNIGKTRLLALLESIREAPTVSQMNNLVECIADFYFTYSSLMKNFIAIVNGCYEISSYKAFMRDLEESSKLLHDFVISLRNMHVANDRIKIDYKFFRFLKLYEDEIVKKAKRCDADEVVKEMQGYIDIFENKVKPFFKKSSISRKTRKRLEKGFKELVKTSKSLKIQRKLLEDLKTYVPSYLLPIAILIEQTETLTLR